MGELKHLEKLKGVDLRLVGVIGAAMKDLPFDCVVGEGVRTTEQAFVNFGKGRTEQQCLAVGCPARYAQPKLGKVTWVSNPLATKHLSGKAVDIYPLLANSQLDQGTTPIKMAHYDALYHAVMAAAAVEKVRVRYGGDWDQDGVLREKGETDSPHFELS